MFILHDHDCLDALHQLSAGSSANLPSPTLMFAHADLKHSYQSQWLFVGFTFLFFDVFALGILPVSWMYASEIMPLRTRNKGVALGVSVHWLSNFVVVSVTPQAIANLGYKLYIIWAVLNASFVPITWLFYPESARRSLEDMDEIFTRERFGITKTRSPGQRVAGYEMVDDHNKVDWDEVEESDTEL